MTMTVRGVADTMKILVCGGCNYDDRDLVRSTLDELGNSVLQT